MSYKLDFKRNKEMYEKYKEGNLSLEKIGQMYNVSRQQVFLIVKNIEQYKDFAGFDVLYELADGKTNLICKIYTTISFILGKEDFTMYDIINIDLWEFSKNKAVGESTVQLLKEFQDELKRL